MTPREIRRACGQLLCAGFEGTSAPAELLGRIRRSEVGSVILFRPNLVDVAGQADARAAGALVGSLRAAAGDLPLPVAIDQEGGLVQRLRAPFTEWPSMRVVADAGDPRRTFEVGRALGEELALLGIGWNFAPVLDVNTNPANPVIGTRAFGSDPATVITHALAFWRGLRAAGIRGCGKHFPGHGDTTSDSHHDLPSVAHSLDRLRTVELAPFAAAVQAGAEALMSAHVLFPALDPGRPATLSPAALMGLLRGALGFQGLLVSDDLGMKALADRHTIAEIVVEGLVAGLDQFIIRGPLEQQQTAWESLVRAVEGSEALARRLDASLGRIVAFKATAEVGPPAPPDQLSAAFPWPAHRTLAASFAVGGAEPAPGSSSPVTIY